MSLKTIHGKLVKIRTKPPHSFYGEFKPTTPYRKPVPKPKPDLSGKGKYLGLCNRSACLAPGPTWWNTGSNAYYCGICAEDINLLGCRKFGDPEILFKVTGFDEDGQPLYDVNAKKDYHAEYLD